MIKVNDAIKRAEKEIKKQIDEYIISSVYDLGDSFVVNWDSSDDGAELSDNMPIEVNKRTGKASVFVLPNKRNFERLKKAQEVPLDG